MYFPNATQKCALPYSYVCCSFSKCWRLILGIILHSKSFPRTKEAFQHNPSKHHRQRAFMAIARVSILSVSIPSFFSRKIHVSFSSFGHDQKLSLIAQKRLHTKNRVSLVRPFNKSSTQNVYHIISKTIQIHD